MADGIEGAVKRLFCVKEMDCWGGCKCVGKTGNATILLIFQQ